MTTILPSFKKGVLVGFLCLVISFSAKAQLNRPYTIGGVSPNYATFNAAVNDLVTNGVSGPVTFNVRNGTYSEQISIGIITGVSAVNKVVFQSETGDSSRLY